MKKILLIISLFIFYSKTFAHSKDCNTLHVRTCGNDVGAVKGSLEDAWKSPLIALNLASSGDIVHVHEGVYVIDSTMHQFGVDSSNVMSLIKDSVTLILDDGVEIIYNNKFSPFYDDTGKYFNMYGSGIVFQKYENQLNPSDDAVPLIRLLHASSKIYLEGREFVSKTQIADIKSGDIIINTLLPLRAINSTGLSIRDCNGDVRLLLNGGIETQGSSGDYGYATFTVRECGNYNVFVEINGDIIASTDQGIFIYNHKTPLRQNTIRFNGNLYVRRGFGVTLSWIGDRKTDLLSFEMNGNIVSDLTLDSTKQKHLFYTDGAFSGIATLNGNIVDLGVKNPDLGMRAFYERGADSSATIIINGDIITDRNTQLGRFSGNGKVYFNGRLQQLSSFPIFYIDNNFNGDINLLTGCELISNGGKDFFISKPVSISVWPGVVSNVTSPDSSLTELINRINRDSRYE